MRRRAGKALIILIFLQSSIFTAADAATTVLQCDITQCPNGAQCPPTFPFAFDPSQPIGKDSYGDEVVVGDKEIRSMGIPTDGINTWVNTRTLDRYTGVMTVNAYGIDSETAKN